MIVSEALRTSGLVRSEAELLLAFATGQSRTWVFAHPESSISHDAAAAYLALSERRRQGEPIAYLVGQRSFWTLDLAVAPGVLIPRGDTELLVERGLAVLQSVDAARILDMGTGSGAIALALASELPLAEILAIDVAPDALSIAESNACRLQIRNVTFIQSSWFDALAGQRFDLIVSNPPYIAEHDGHLKVGDLRFEPRHALASGRDGLAALREIVAGAPRHLFPGGWLMVEHGFEQGAEVRSLFEDAGFDDVGTHADLQGHPRVTEGRLPGL